MHLRLPRMSLPRPNAGADSAHAATFARDRCGLSRRARSLRVLRHAPGNIRFQFPICSERASSFCAQPPLWVHHAADYVSAVLTCRLCRRVRGPSTTPSSRQETIAAPTLEIDACCSPGRLGVDGTNVAGMRPRVVARVAIGSRPMSPLLCIGRRKSVRWSCKTPRRGCCSSYTPTCHPSPVWLSQRTQVCVVLFLY